MMMAAILSTIGKLKAAAKIAIEVPMEVTASDRLSLAAASKALERTFLPSGYYINKQLT